MSTQLVSQDKVTKVLCMHSEIVAASRGTLEKAIKLGGLLCEMREGIDHGGWLPWIEQNISEIPERTVQRYIQLWENRESIREQLQIRRDDGFEGLPTIQDALALIQKPRAIPVSRPAPVKEKRSRRIREVEATVTPAATPGPGSSDGPPAERPEKMAEPEPDDHAGEITVNRCPSCGQPLPV
jgi:hypothetical protein